MGVKTPVRCVETGEVFESMTVAGLSVGKNYARVDTGHGKLSSYEQTIMVSAQQEIVESGEENRLSGPGILPLLFLICFIALRRRV